MSVNLSSGWRLPIKHLLATLLLAGLFAVLPLFQAQAKTLTIFTVNVGFSNYVNEDGELTGFNVALVSEMLLRLEERSTLVVVPWSRGYEQTRTTPYTALFTTVRTKQREDIFQWVGPLNVLRNVLVARQDFPVSSITIEAAKKSGTIGCLASGVRWNILNAMGFENLTEVHGEDAVGMLLRMLQAGRIRLMATGPEEVASAAKRTQTPPDAYKEVMQLQSFYGYLAFSPSTPKHIVDRLQTILDEMKADGTYERILYAHGVDPGMMAFDDPTDYSPSVAPANN